MPSGYNLVKTFIFDSGLYTIHFISSGLKLYKYGSNVDLTPNPWPSGDPDQQRAMREKGITDPFYVDPIGKDLGLKECLGKICSKPSK